MKKIHLCIALLVLCRAGVFAQDKAVWAELQKVRDRYAHLDHYSVNLTYKIFKGHTSPEMMELTSGRFETTKSGSRYVLGDLEMLRNSRYFVSVDKANQEMDISPLTEKNAMPSFIDFGQMDSMMRKYDMVSQIPAPNGTRTLRFDFSQNLFFEFERIDITYLPSGNLVKAVMYYRQTAEAYGEEGDFKPRLEVEYANHDFEASFAPEHFSEQKFFVLSNGKIDPKPIYRTYKIYSLL